RICRAYGQLPGVIQRTLLRCCDRVGTAPGRTQIPAWVSQSCQAAPCHEKVRPRSPACTVRISRSLGLAAAASVAGSATAAEVADVLGANVLAADVLVAEAA